MKKPEIRIEATPRGVRRVRCLYSNKPQKRDVFVMAARLLPLIARLDEEIRK